MPETEKHYFVFTDSPEVEFEKDNSKITRIFQENLGWPNNTLKRYEMFLKIEDKLKEFDHLFFFNSNILFVEKIDNNEILPGDKESIVACLHPGYFNKDIKKFPYDHNKDSTAYVDVKAGKYYFQGAFNGGRTLPFIEAIKEMNKNVLINEERKIITPWQDESHWNKYLNGRKDIKILTPSYLYPENSNIPFEPKIIILDKNKLGGHSSFRNKIELHLVINNIKAKIKNIIQTLKPNTIIKIQGGLGNQLFQYAYGRNEEFFGKKIIFDTTFFNGNRAKTDTVRNFKLNNFNIKTRSIFSNKKRPVSDFLYKIKLHLGMINYQSENSFKSIEDLIHKEFTLKDPMTLRAQEAAKEISNTKNSVSLHVRRGDYISDKKTNVYHGTCDITYYKKAIEYIHQNLESPTFFIFSDDIHWVKENLKLENAVYVSNPEIKDYEELVLMSTCSHNIIANSSFSWWGAWLNQNPNKIVIGPKQWLTNKTAAELDILPAEWIQI